MEFRVELTQNGREVKASLYLKDGVKDKLQSLFSPRGFSEYIQSYGVRCDSDYYFAFYMTPQEALNFSLFYDYNYIERHTSGTFDTYQQARQFIKDFYDWWESEGKIVLSEIENLARSEMPNARAIMFNEPTDPQINLPKPPEPHLNIRSKRKLLIVGNEVYEIHLKSKTDNTLKQIEDELKREYEYKIKAFREQFIEYHKQLEDKVNKIVKQYSSKPVIPDWLNKDILRETKAMLYKSSDNHLCFLTPYDYKPIYLKKDDKTYKITDPIDHIPVYIKIVMAGNGQVKKIELLKENFNRFHHYHSLEENDCVGDMALPKITNGAEFIEFVNRVKEGLRLINVDDIAIKHPDDLPHYSDYEIEEVDVWTT